MGIILKKIILQHTCDPFWSVAAPNIFSGLVLWAREALTQIIQINNTKRMRKMTAPATPPAIYANSLFSPQKSPVNDPAHWHTGLPPFFQSCKDEYYSMKYRCVNYKLFSVQLSTLHL